VCSITVFVQQGLWSSACRFDQVNPPNFTLDASHYCKLLAVRRPVGHKCLQIFGGQLKFIGAVGSPCAPQSIATIRPCYPDSISRIIYPCGICDKGWCCTESVRSIELLQSKGLGQPHKEN